jgi:phosphate transport system permease protein
VAEIRISQPQIKREPTVPQGPESAGPGRPAKVSPVRKFLLSRGNSAVADEIFRWLMAACGISIFGIVALIVWRLVVSSSLTRHKFGLGFFYKAFIHPGGGSPFWDPVNEQFSALPFIYGTIVTSFLALLIAVPLGIGLAIFLTEMCPRFLRGPLSFLTELLAAIPSVIYGLWALFVLVPILREYVNPFLIKTLSWTRLVDDQNTTGLGFLAAGVILSIMILPIISSLTREMMSAVPESQREAVLALGATRWEMIHMGVLRNARIGIVGAVILGLGRALGETMAVTMVIGNTPQIRWSLLANGSSMAAVIANEFSEAVAEMYLSALIEIGLALFIVTVIVNAIARLLVWAVTRGAPSAAH